MQPHCMCNATSEPRTADPPVTSRPVLGQVVICQGCCCGRVDRGYPAVPVERLKAVWKQEKLNRAIQLTISGCVGPCDLANVVLVLDETQSHWFGGITTDAPYEALIEWARACLRSNRQLALPPAIEPFRFQRFGGRLPSAGDRLPAAEHGPQNNATDDARQP